MLCRCSIARPTALATCSAAVAAAPVALAVVETKSTTLDTARAHSLFPPSPVREA